MDILNLFLASLSTVGLPQWGILALGIVAISGIHLWRTCGNEFLTKLFHRRNAQSLFMLCAFLAVLFGIYCAGIWQKIPTVLRLMIAVLFLCYLVMVLWSVNGPILFAKRTLSKYEKFYKQGKIYEHFAFTGKMPWYFLDMQERNAYYQLCAQYYTAGDDWTSCYFNGLQKIDEKFLYPDEQQDLLISKALSLCMMGDLVKAQIFLERVQQQNCRAEFIWSFLDENQNRSDSAFEHAKRAKALLPVSNTDMKLRVQVMNQLGRQQMLQSNLPEAIECYEEALRCARILNVHSMLHVNWQNLLFAKQKSGADETELNKLVQLYCEAFPENSINDTLTLMNFRAAWARQRGNIAEEEKGIQNGYQALCKITTGIEKLNVEVSTLKMLANGGFDTSPVILDLDKHFDDIFSASIPARMTLVQDIVAPRREWTEVETEIYARWIPKILQYAAGQALDDENQHIATLRDEQVAARNHFLQQKIDFIRRGNPVGHTDEVIEGMEKLRRSYHDNHMLILETRQTVNIAMEYTEQVAHELREREPTTALILEWANKAMTLLQSLRDNPCVAPEWIRVGHCFACVCDAVSTDTALKAFKALNVSPNHFSAEVQEMLRQEIDWLAKM